ncbi:Cell envelope-related transcriptional attenuator domain protein [Streptomyces sp. YIM 130001]|uniref:LCP family protein n=1 Tax=Streptomyces sp. YIM 130001 TaxID=2259644 RepID=UPI000E647FBC|nr:LCP family protein [Streptomyces sp. YIM 130001]RII08709.1 Cell envelope-related transcriptional attenuator domain protein [Streptomyces sp. YIM 130001]
MNDRQYDPYAGGQDPYAEPVYDIVGYDEYGRPVYQQVPQQPPGAPQQPGQSGHTQQFDPYASDQGYGYDPYGAAANTGPQAPVPDQGYGGQGYGAQGYDQQHTGQNPQYTGHSPQYTGQHPQQSGYDPYGQAGGTGQQPRVDDRTAWVPQQHHPEAPGQQPGLPPQRGPQQGPDGGAERDYRTEQFSFIEEPDEESEDVIDWLKFTESRTERREEAKRRGRNRLVALVVVLALALTGGVGYLWYAGKLPGVSEPDGDKAAASGPQKRDVIVVHLHNTKKGGTSTALLVDNSTTGRGSTVLLPNSLSVTDDDGAATTLGKSVDDDGTGGTRDSINSLLGTRVEGTWRLDTPYLENLVELVGNIDIDTDADVPDPSAKKKGQAPLVEKGEQQTLSGAMAVAYATHRAKGEPESAQLKRFGQVMQGVLRKMSTDPQAATTTVETLTLILDPPLDEKGLGAFLAKLAGRAKGGDYQSTVLPVQRDGTLTRATSQSVVKDLLGGKVKSPEQGEAVRVSLSGGKKAVQRARVDLVNGGWSIVAGSSSGGSASRVTYGDTAQQKEASEVAKTLGLPSGAVRKGKTAANADITVVLGSDYSGS